MRFQLHKPSKIHLTVKIDWNSWANSVHYGFELVELIFFYKFQYGLIFDQIHIETANKELNKYFLLNWDLHLGQFMLFF